MNFSLQEYFRANDSNNKETSNSILENAAEETLTWRQVISAAASIRIRGEENPNKMESLEQRDF